MGWTNSVVTAAGVDLLNESLAGHTLYIDQAVGGAGVIAPDDLVLATDVTEKKQTFKLLGIEDVDGGKRVGIQITNEGVTEKYILHQIAMLAKLNYQDSYYMLAIMQDDRGVEIPAKTETPDFLFEVYAVIAISNKARITVNVDASAAVSSPYMEQRLAEEISKHNLDENSHADIHMAVEQLKDAAAAKDLTGSGAPSETTSAKVGQSYVDQDTGTVYTCIAVADGKTTWEETGSKSASSVVYDPSKTKLGTKDVQGAIDELYALITALEFIHIGTTAPDDTAMLWIDTANDSIIKYYNGTAWVPAHAAWAE